MIWVKLAALAYDIHRWWRKRKRKARRDRKAA